MNISYYYYIMKLFNTLYATILFIIFTPGILFTISKKSSKIYIAIFHAILFGIIFHITRTLLWDSIAIYETADTISNTINPTYNPDPNSVNPNGPPFATICNINSIKLSNSNGEVCEKSGENYKWVTPCNSDKVGFKNENGKTCVNQGNNIFNWA